MAKKQQSLENKLGSWTDQANLTRTQSSGLEDAPEGEAVTGAADLSTHAREIGAREAYPVNRSLMVRIADVAAAHDMNQQELVGYLLTWSLDQVESGSHQIETT